MNYIVSFMLQITNNEEDSFYLLLGLFENTDFSSIFIEELTKLKIFFYVFERLLFIYLPEIYYYFRVSNIVKMFLG